MTWFDSALVLFILMQMAIGIRQGVSVSLASLGALLVSASLALFGGPWLAARLAPWVAWPRPILALCLALLLGLAVSPILAAGMSRLLAKLPSSERFKRLDRAFGIASGALRGLLVAALVVGLFSTLTGRLPERGTLSEGLLQTAQGPMDALSRHVQQEFPSLIVTPDGFELIAEPAAATPEIAPDRLEQRMLAMVNQERRERGLRELRWDGRLAALARAHSRDMLARNYFAHEDPDGKTAADRAAKAGIRYTFLGENLAFAKTLSQAHRGLMKSPGHRENILRTEFRRVGIGVIRLPQGSQYLPTQAAPAGIRPKTEGYLLITQVFAR